MKPGQMVFLEPGVSMQAIPEISLRDYFAAQALQGFLPDAFQEAPDNYPAKRLAPFWAGMAYQLADEMLKAREA